VFLAVTDRQPPRRWEFDVWRVHVPLALSLVGIAATVLQVLWSLF